MAEQRPEEPEPKPSRYEVPEFIVCPNCDEETMKRNGKYPGHWVCVNCGREEER